MFFFAIIFCLSIGSSYADYMPLGNETLFRKNIKDLIQGKLNFSDPNLTYYKTELTDMTPQNNSKFDFIIIGAGSAGAAIASRLTEDKETKVLLIEAGIEEKPIMDIPFLTEASQLNDQINWMYETESSDKYCLGFKNSRCKWPRGKVMGGSSVLNGMMATRGNSRDFDGWARSTGDISWSYKKMLKYLMKLENFQVKGIKVNKKYHNKNGPIYIGTASDHAKLTEAFIEANKELGLPLNDYNGEEQMGVSYLQSTILDGERWSTNRGYLHSAKFRKNLFLTRKSFVNKILIDENTRTANGVQFTKGYNNITVRIRKEIILSAGAINSPKILMLSGIGPAKHLNDLDIRVIKDAPVGENLMDHIAYSGLVFRANDSYVEKNLLDSSNPNIEMYFTKRKGSLASHSFKALSYINVNNEKLFSNDPNIEILFGTFKGIREEMFWKVIGLPESYSNKYFADDIKQSMCAMWPMILNPKSRGIMLLKNKNPLTKPVIYPNYLNHTEDVTTIIAGIRAVIRLSKTKAFQQYGLEIYHVPLPLCEKFEFNSDDYWECAIRTFTTTIYHYSGTCKMGKETDKTAVVNSKLKVIGIERLRVADASIMPTIVNAHTNIPTIAIGEKIADEIRQEWKRLA